MHKKRKTTAGSRLVELDIERYSTRPHCKNEGQLSSKGVVKLSDTAVIRPSVSSMILRSSQSLPSAGFEFMELGTLQRNANNPSSLVL